MNKAHDRLEQENAAFFERVAKGFARSRLKILPMSCCWMPNSPLMRSRKLYIDG